MVSSSCVFLSSCVFASSENSVPSGFVCLTCVNCGAVGDTPPPNKSANQSVPPDRPVSSFKPKLLVLAAGVQGAQIKRRRERPRLIRLEPSLLRQVNRQALGGRYLRYLGRTRSVGLRVRFKLDSLLGHTHRLHLSRCHRFGRVPPPGCDPSRDVFRRPARSSHCRHFSRSL